MQGMQDILGMLGSLGGLGGGTEGLGGLGGLAGALGGLGSLGNMSGTAGENNPLAMLSMLSTLSQLGKGGNGIGDLGDILGSFTAGDSDNEFADDNDEESIEVSSHDNNPQPSADPCSHCRVRCDRQGLASRLMKMFARWQRIGTAINYLCRDTAKLF